MRSGAAMKLPLRIWDRIEAAFSAVWSRVTGAWFSDSYRPIHSLHRRLRIARSGRPLYRSPGFESLEPKMDVCTFWFSAETGLLFISGSDNETIWIGSDSGGADWSPRVQINGDSTSIAAFSVREIFVSTGTGSNSVYLGSVDSNVFVSLQEIQVQTHGYDNEVYGSSGYNVLNARHGYGGDYDYNALHGAGGTDVLNAQDAPAGSYNLLWGGGGNETLNGGPGENDLIGNGEGEFNTLNGGSGPNYLLGGGGNSTLNGGTGDNTLDGYGGGFNVLNSGPGNNELVGDMGSPTAIDILHGEAGANNFL
jgi:hypothetical protein